MAKKVSALRQYLNSSKSLHYSLILTLPALAIYEIGVIILFQDSFFELRNSGEVLLRSLFESLGLRHPLVISGILLGLFMMVMIRGYKIEKKPGIHANYIVYMLLESMLWGGFIFISLQFFTQLPLQMVSMEEKLSNINLAIGAGIFEELIFRMVVISSILIVLERGLAMGSRVSVPLAIFFSAIVFAGFHLFMEVYSFPIFSQRMFGGILLGSLFYARGYGISVYAHIIYNFLILAYSW
ncbi:MAG: CPBP family intramembrane metalloprotease [Candidatus Marinimicrobia bacterium]|nr:CPBP family intramembrane metalloprotease [Candidatus Neomarinimicrobiota bacterium]